MSSRRRSRQTQPLQAKQADAAETTHPAQREHRPSDGGELLSEHVSITQSFRGPLPPPGALAKYNDAFPGCAERIVAMAERQVIHRQMLESNALDGKLTAERRGQVLGFILALTVIIGGGVLIALDKDASGLTAIVSALAGLVAVFVYGRRKDAEERREKRSDFASPQLRLPYEETTPDPGRAARSNDHEAPG